MSAKLKYHSCCFGAPSSEARLIASKSSTKLRVAIATMKMLMPMLRGELSCMNLRGMPKNPPMKLTI